MKKTFFYIGCLALLMAGCNKVEMVETPVDEPAMETPRHLTVDINVEYPGDTRSVKTGWEVGDVIYVTFDHFFSEEQQTSGSYVSDVVYYMTLTYDGSVWQSAFSNEALEQYLLEEGNKTGSLAAVYFSDFVPKFSFRRTSQGGGKEDYRIIRLSGGDQIKGFYLFDEQCSYSVANGVLTASLMMHPYDALVHFFVPDLIIDSGDSPSRYTLYSEQIDLCRFDTIMSDKIGADADFTAPVVVPDIFHSTSNPISSAARPDGAVFCGSLPSDIVGQSTTYVITIVDRGGSSNNLDYVEYTLTRTATLSGKEAIVLPSLDSGQWEKRGKVNGHEWVEIAGAKWATVNVGGDPDNYSVMGTFFTWLAVQALPNDATWGWGAGWHVATRAEWMRMLGGLKNPTGANTPYPLSYEKVYLQSEYSDEQYYYGMEVFPYDNPNAANKLFFPKGAGYMNEQNQSVAWDKGVGYYWADNADGSGSSVFELDPNVSFPFSLLSKDRPSDRCQMFVRLVAD